MGSPELIAIQHQEVLISVNSAVPKKRPVAPHGFGSCRIDFGGEDLFGTSAAFARNSPWGPRIKLFPQNIWPSRGVFRGQVRSRPGWR